MTPAARARPHSLEERFRAVRARSLAICRPLEAEDYTIQSMPDASPPKWHLAHTTWFFETFVLEAFDGGSYQPFDRDFRVLFNSYYQAVGAQHPRAQRGLLSRPSIERVRDYRRRVDEATLALCARAPDRDRDEIAARIELGLEHEQQHQELLLIDIKHNFYSNPLRPAYRDDLVATPPDAVAAPLLWSERAGGVCEIGHGGGGFAFDNESPRHRVLLRPFALGSRLATCGEWLEFIDDGGYRRPELWLSDGWSEVAQRGWNAPLYWERGDAGAGWQLYTLGGMRALAPAEPVVHVSYYEADAFARWAGARLPTEMEWEVVAAACGGADGNTLERDRLHPTAAIAAGDRAAPAQLFGDAWEHTVSAYAPYPGYQPPAGALGEYNGKFMCSQMVQRGGSALTPRAHLRPSYRNFFYPDQRWNMQGVRLARDVD